MKSNIPNLIHISRRCRQCHETTKFSLDQDALARWQLGELIQNAFPHLTADERELLISGTCGKCFDALFAEPKGWPGDGTGEDDLADHNQNEADDYREE